MQKIQPPQVQKQIEINQLNQLIGDFDSNLTYSALKAGYSLERYEVSKGNFDKWQECFDYCQIINQGKHSDECFFVVPMTPTLQFDYHFNWQSLISVIHQINKEMRFRAKILIHCYDNYGYYSTALIHLPKATWYHYYFDEHKLLIDEIDDFKKTVEASGEKFIEDPGFGRLVAESHIDAAWKCVVKALQLTKA